jgi:predicted TIM-barrel fold metal-dependent hydrolase
MVLGGERAEADTQGCRTRDIRTGATMEIFDCHANTGWDAHNIRKNILPSGQTYGQLLAKMDTYEIAEAIIVPFPSPGAQYNQNSFWYELENHYLELASRFSKRLTPFVGVHPGDKKSVHNIRTLSLSINLKGVKFSHQTLMGYSIEKLNRNPLMNIIQDLNLVFMIHIGTGKEPGAGQAHTTLNYAIQVAEQHPHVRFIFCHLGRLHERMMDALNMENVYMDTAGLSMATKWKEFIALEPLAIFKNASPVRVIEKLVSNGYADKLLFGSDEPYTPYAAEMRVLHEADISNAVRRRIFSANIRGLLND